MRTKITLIGFNDQGNLGLGYLAATLKENDFDVETLDFRRGETELLTALKTTEPILIGFSIIFQFFIPQFSRLAAAIRAAGLSSHLTAGGHYPTLCYANLFTEIPELDSVVRGEGEQTLVELASNIARKQNWQQIDGLAYQHAGECHTTAPRALIENLDILPYPDRSDESLAILGLPASPVLASRGCPRSCSFCSIRQFYKESPGKTVRARQPEQVVAEINALYQNKGVRVILFQDDDFPIVGRSGKLWLQAFLAELEQQKLVGKIIWKISCRADEVEPVLFKQMRDYGLYMVYLGLESGNSEGLKVLNKQLSKEDNLTAIKTLKELELATTYGYMLFDPSSSFSSVQENIDFLKTIVTVGNLPALFCRMLPYAGTDIAQQLSAAGRLTGSHINPDYDFLQCKLNHYYSELNPYIQTWIQGSQSLASQLNWAWQEFWIIERLFPPLDAAASYRETLSELTDSSNRFLLGFTEESLANFQADETFPLSLTEFTQACEKFSQQLLEQRNRFVAPNEAVMLEAIRQLNSPAYV